MLEYVDMGAHTFYVWLAYAVSVSAIVLLVISSIRSRKATMKLVKGKITRLERFKASQSSES